MYYLVYSFQILPNFLSNLFLIKDIKQKLISIETTRKQWNRNDYPFYYAIFNSIKFSLFFPNSSKFSFEFIPDKRYKKLISIETIG